MSVEPDPTEILAVSFDPQWIEITWQDVDEVGRRVQRVHLDRIDPTLVADEIEDVKETLREILAAAAVESRGAPATIYRAP